MGIVVINLRVRLSIAVVTVLAIDIPILANARLSIECPGQLGVLPEFSGGKGNPPGAEAEGEGEEIPSVASETHVDAEPLKWFGAGFLGCRS